MKEYTLANGNKIPIIGFGMWQNKEPKKAVEAVIKAVEVGFKQIDNASAYQNEHLVGEGLKKSSVPREELFITSKLKNAAHGYDNVKEEVDETLKQLGTDYLYLIHWPVVKGHGEDWKKDNLETWKAMEELYEERKVKAIGVSNFSIEHLDNLVQNARIKPMVNQLLVHPGVTQRETRDYCKQHDILVQAYSPLSPLDVLKEDDKVKEMLVKYNKTIAQLLLRFGIEIGVVPLTKSVHKERIEENFDVFNFSLDEEDTEYLLNWTHPDFKEPDNKNERPPQIS